MSQTLTEFSKEKGQILAEKLFIYDLDKQDDLSIFVFNTVLDFKDIMKQQGNAPYMALQSSMMASVKALGNSTDYNTDVVANTLLPAFYDKLAYGENIRNTVFDITDASRKQKLVLI